MELPARSMTRPGCTNGSTRRPNGRRIVRSGQRSAARWRASRQGLGGFWADAGAGATMSAASTPARARNERYRTAEFIATATPSQREHGPRGDRPAGAAQGLAHDRVRDPEPAPAARLPRGGEDRGDHAALPVHRGTARVARPHQAAQGGDPPPDRAVAVGVLAEHGARGADPGRLHVVGTVLGIAQDGGAGARARALVHGQRPHARTPGTRRTARSFFTSKWIAWASRRSPRPPSCTDVSL